MGLYEFNKIVKKNCFIIILLLGVTFISMSIGPFQNPDTVWEFKAANGVINWGIPFVEVEGSLINQPPLGFYTQGLFLSIFGISIETGAILVMLFGLGCTFLVYQIGKIVYSTQTGLLASAFFALTPWQLVLSNTFLIDTQCLFFSLLSLYLAILAFTNNSNRLLFTSGIIFALAFYTKLFAIFILIPISLFFLYLQKERLAKIPIKLFVFFFPLILATLIWYIVVFNMMPSWLPKGLGYMFNHSDFSDVNPPEVYPTYSFISTFLFNYALGYFFVITVIISLIVNLAFRKQISKRISIIDFIFFIPIIIILALTAILGVMLNLKVPYTSVIKYAYQTLPFFSLIAASLAYKIFSLITFKKKSKSQIIISVSGSLLIIMTLLGNIYSANKLSTTEFLIFRVEPDRLLGYSFDNFHAITYNSPLMYLQYFGFIIVMFSLIYSIKDRIFNYWKLSTPRGSYVNFWVDRINQRKRRSK